MRRTRTGLLLAAAACLFLSAGALAQTAPTLSGATGLIEIAERRTVPRRDGFSFGMTAASRRSRPAPSLSSPRRSPTTRSATASAGSG